MAVKERLSIHQGFTLNTNPKLNLQGQKDRLLGYGFTVDWAASLPSRFEDCFLSLPLSRCQQVEAFRVEGSERGTLQKL